MRLSGLGLVAQGAIQQSFLARLPSFLDRLTLVMNPRLQVSTRAVNALRAGRAVHRYAELEPIKSIWICVAEELLERTVAELARAIPLNNRTVILCDTLQNSRHFFELNHAAARVATLHVMPEARERIFVAEGHSVALKEIAAILHAEERKLIQLEPQAKPLYVSGLHLSSHLLLPWVGAAVESFRLAGLSRSESTLAVQAMAAAAMRAYTRAGEKALSRNDAAYMQNLLDQAREQIRESNPSLAEFYDAGAGSWLKMIGGRDFWRAPKEKARAMAAGSSEDPQQHSSPSAAK